MLIHYDIFAAFDIADYCHASCRHTAADFRYAFFDAFFLSPLCHADAISLPPLSLSP